MLVSREKKRDKDREELWTRLDKLALDDVGKKDKDRSPNSLPTSASATSVNATSNNDDKGRKSS